MTRRLAAKIAYLGEDFSGSQRQPGLRTVEGEVRRSISGSRPPAARTEE
jgi:tRNA U38,U39,U40 pseudouridine synthase TruA